jgi:cytochrome P450
MALTAARADDITVRALIDDPYPIYARLRRESPACYVAAVGLWFVTRWTDVVAAAEDAAAFPASMAVSPLDRTLGGRNVLTVDGLEHERWRAPMETTLRPRKVESVVPSIVESIANELIDGFAADGEADLKADYCEPLAASSLGEVIGLQGLSASTLQRWFHDLAIGTSNYEGDAEKQAVADRTSAEIDETLRPRLAQLLDSPDGSMVSDMLHAETGDLDERMRAFMPTLKLALIGGLQEPADGLGSTIAGILGNEDHRAAFLDDPAGLARRAVDEGIRWVSPIGTQGRAAGPDVSIAGVEIPEGEAVGLIIPSANRDEEVWGPSADSYDLFRARHANAAFGFGPHFCVGHQLARLQMRIGLRLLVERLPGIHLDPQRPPSFRGWEYRGPVSLHARWPDRVR